MNIQVSEHLDLGINYISFFLKIKSVDWAIFTAFFNLKDIQQCHDLHFKALISNIYSNGYI